MNSTLARSIDDAHLERPQMPRAVMKAHLPKQQMLDLKLVIAAIVARTTAHLTLKELSKAIHDATGRSIAENQLGRWRTGEGQQYTSLGKPALSFWRQAGVLGLVFGLALFSVDAVAGPLAIAHGAVEIELPYFVNGVECRTASVPQPRNKTSPVAARMGAAKSIFVVDLPSQPQAVGPFFGNYAPERFWGLGYVNRKRKLFFGEQISHGEPARVVFQVGPVGSFADVVADEPAEDIPWRAAAIANRDRDADFLWKPNIPAARLVLSAMNQNVLMAKRYVRAFNLPMSGERVLSDGNRVVGSSRRDSRGPRGLPSLVSLPSDEDERYNRGEDQNLRQGQHVFSRRDAAFFALLLAGLGCGVLGWSLYDNGYRWYGRLCWLLGWFTATSALGGVGFGGIRAFWGL